MNSLLTAITNALKSSVTIAAWCLTNYAKTHTLYVGVDSAKPPGLDECPVIYIFPKEKQSGFDLEKQVHMFGVICAIHDATLTQTEITVTVAEEDQVVAVNTYSGVANVEAFRKLVEAVVVAITLSNGDTVAMSDSDFDTTESFPFFMVGMEIQISHDYSNGNDVWA